MAQQTINIGLAPDDGTGDTLRAAGAKINANFDELYATPGGVGSVPVGGIIMWSGTINAAGALSPTWEVCDGTANTPGPDLRDKFIVGAKQDDGGVAKTNIEGSLQQSGGVTGHLHSAHGDLTHAGITVGDHTGLTHTLAIGNHPDLTHAALSHAAQEFSHADHAIASMTHAHAGMAHADISAPSVSVSNVGLTHADLSIPTISVSVAGITHADISFASTAGVSSFASGTNRSGLVSRVATTLTIVSHPSNSGIRAAHTETIVSHPTHSGIAAAQTLTIVSHPTFSGTQAATTLTHANHSFPSLSHQAIGTHTFAAHAITHPVDHGTAGTLTHSFSQPNDHTVSVHDTVSNVNPYFALAFIQRMS